jgi:hypothetical protein
LDQATLMSSQLLRTKSTKEAFWRQFRRPTKSPSE